MSVSGMPAAVRKKASIPNSLLYAHLGQDFTTSTVAAAGIAPQRATAARGSFDENMAAYSFEKISHKTEDNRKFNFEWKKR